MVLFSGRGGNLQAIASAIAAGQLNARIIAAISNRPSAAGLRHALAHRLPTHIIDHQLATDLQHCEQQLQHCIDTYAPDLIILAGFMRVLSPDFVQHYHGRIINLHPSLLPKYQGLNTHQRALDNGDDNHGASVHFVTPELDGGPVIANFTLSINNKDTATTLANRLAPQEHRLLLAVIALFSRHAIQLRNQTIYFDDQPLTCPLQLDSEIHWS